MCILLFFQISEEARPQFVQYGNIQNKTLWSFIGQYLLGFLQYQWRRLTLRPTTTLADQFSFTTILYTK